MTMAIPFSLLIAIKWQVSVTFYVRQKIFQAPKGNENGLYRFKSRFAGHSEFSIDFDYFLARLFLQEIFAVITMHFNTWTKVARVGNPIAGRIYAERIFKKLFRSQEISICSQISLSLSLSFRQREHTWQRQVAVDPKANRSSVRKVSSFRPRGL